VSDYVSREADDLFVLLGELEGRLRCDSSAYVGDVEQRIAALVAIKAHLPTLPLKGEREIAGAIREEWGRLDKQAQLNGKIRTAYHDAVAAARTVIEKGVALNKDKMIEYAEMYSDEPWPKFVDGILAAGAGLP
jgi:hypothetical protein